MSQRGTLYVVVEGPTDAQLIRAVVGQETASSLRFFAAGGGISLATIGRNILVHEGGPVLLVMDSDTTNQRLAEELKSMTYLATSSVAPTASGRDDWVKVFAFVPEIEVMFFESPQALESLLGKPIPEDRIREGLLNPKVLLTQLLDKGQCPAPVSPLPAGVADLLAQGKQARFLKATIESMLTATVGV